MRPLRWIYNALVPLEDAKWKKHDKSRLGCPVEWESILLRTTQPATSTVLQSKMETAATVLISMEKKTSQVFSFSQVRKLVGKTTLTRLILTNKEPFRQQRFECQYGTIHFNWRTKRWALPFMPIRLFKLSELPYYTFYVFK